MLLARTSRARWLADPSQVPPTRLFTVHLLTPAVYSEYATNFDAFMQHYYSRTSNHTVLLVSPQAHLKDALTPSRLCSASDIASGATTPYAVQALF